MNIWLSLCLVGCVLSTGFVAAPAQPEPAPNPGTALITGSDRGIGLALTQEFAARGWRVIATCRDPAKATELADFARDHLSVRLETLDVSDNAQIDALVAKLKGQPIDVLVNNAGVTGNIEAQGLNKLDPDDFGRALRINSYAPLRISAAFLDLVAASKQRKIVGMSSGYGSLTLVPDLAASGYPNAYYYAMSKAALNMGMREFALETAPRKVTTVLLSPGGVDTDMQRDIRTYMSKIGKPITLPVLTAAESAHAMVVTIENLHSEQHGKFLTRKGEEIPW